MEMNFKIRKLISKYGNEFQNTEMNFKIRKWISKRDLSKNGKNKNYLEIDVEKASGIILKILFVNNIDYPLKRCSTPIPYQTTTTVTPFQI